MNYRYHIDILNVINKPDGRLLLVGIVDVVAHFAGFVLA
jgi:hypothetical protein